MPTATVNTEWMDAYDAGGVGGLMGPHWLMQEGWANLSCSF